MLTVTGSKFFNAALLDVMRNRGNCQSRSCGGYHIPRDGSRGVRRELEHPSNIHTFTAKIDNCSEAVLKIIKLLLLIMTTALKLC